MPSIPFFLLRPDLFTALLYINGMVSFLHVFFDGVEVLDGWMHWDTFDVCMYASVNWQGVKVRIKEI